MKYFLKSSSSINSPFICFAMRVYIKNIILNIAVIYPSPDNFDSEISCS